MKIGKTLFQLTVPQEIFFIKAWVILMVIDVESLVDYQPVGFDGPFNPRN
jgi:hypothetical protein